MITLPVLSNTISSNILLLLILYYNCISTILVLSYDFTITNRNTLNRINTSRLILITHHKSGTAYATNIYSYLCFNITYYHQYLHTSNINIQQFIQLRNNQYTGGNSCQYIMFLLNGIQRRLPKQNNNFIHFIRNPLDMLLSGYFYHKECNEPLWTNTSNHNDFLTFFPLYFPINGSYCHYLQSVNMKKGLEIELLRTMNANDGIMKMIQDMKYLQNYTYNSNLMTICLKDTSSLLHEMNEYINHWNIYNRSSFEVLDMKSHHTSTHSKTEAMKIAIEVILNSFTMEELRYFPCGFELQLPEG